MLSLSSLPDVPIKDVAIAVIAALALGGLLGNLNASSKARSVTPPACIHALNLEADAWGAMKDTVDQVDANILRSWMDQHGSEMGSAVAACRANAGSS